MFKSKSDIIEFTKNWLDLNPKTRNISRLSRESNVSDSTLRRILQGESILTIDTALKLMTVVDNSSERLNEVMGVYLDTPKIYHLDEIKGSADNEMRAFASDKIAIEIAHRADTEKGISRSEILAKYGDVGDDVCQQLMKTDILTQKNNFLFSTKSIITTTLETSLETIKSLLSLVQKTGRSQFFYRSVDLTDDGMKQLRELNRKHAESVEKIVKNKEFKGKNSCVYSQVFGIYSEEKGK